MKKRIIIIIAGITTAAIIATIVVVVLFTGNNTPTPTLNPPTTTTPALSGSDDRPFDDTTTPTEVIPGICPETWIQATDSDGDGLPDRIEGIYRTDETIADTDGDGFKDGEEVKNGYDPTQAEGNPQLDSDNDGLNDSDECKWNTDVFNPDTDEDGFKDGEEVKNGYDPTIKSDGSGNDKIATIPPPQDPNSPLPTVTGEDIIITQDTSPESIIAYLTAADAIEQQPPTDQEVVTGIEEALESSSVKLGQVRAQIEARIQQIKAIPAPQPAKQYHTTLIALTQYLNDELGVIEQYARTDFNRTLESITNLRDGISFYYEQLQQERANLENQAISGV